MSIAETTVVVTYNKVHVEFSEKKSVTFWACCCKNTDFTIWVKPKDEEMIAIGWGTFVTDLKRRGGTGRHWSQSGGRGRGREGGGGECGQEPLLWFPCKEAVRQDTRAYDWLV